MKKQNIPLLVAVGLPFIIILSIVSYVLYSHSRGRPPQSFLYILASPLYWSGSDCTIYKNYYEVNDKKQLVMSAYDYNTPAGNYGSTPPPHPSDPCEGYSRRIIKEAPQLYLYNPVNDSSKAVSFADLKQREFTGELLSEDGFSVGYIHQDAGIFELFGGADSSAIYESKGNSHIKTSIADISEGSYYNNSFRMVGWIK